MRQGVVLQSLALHPEAYLQIADMAVVLSWTLFEGRKQGALYMALLWWLMENETVAQMRE